MSVFGTLAGCGDDGPGNGSGITAEIGSGTIDWEPLAAEQDLELVAGPQGGHHFIVHARARGLVPGDPSRPNEPGNPVTVMQLFDTDMRRLDIRTSEYRFGYTDIGDDWYALPSARIVQVVEDYVDELWDTRVLLRLEITDAAGHTGSDERWVHAVAEPGGGSDAGVADAGTVDGG